MRVRFTRLALQDIDDAYDFIAHDSPQNADLVIGRIERSVDTILAQPAIGRPGRIPGTREFIVARTPYILVYRERRSEVQILTVLHTSRKYPAA